ncbi:MAG: hypothetical protein NZ699_11000 [Roseiflexus sp.]|nr:hypothetical protein [Roseiflexus sp.]MDW8233975.1 hypothetical protein [Roseiflexaceae bacterium]
MTGIAEALHCNVPATPVQNRRQQRDAGIGQAWDEGRRAQVTNRSLHSNALSG